jgi:3'-phosphoadenosine 5'-phosphosulfate sulfotransferase (PAPS reductase)/FAD synthetase
MPTDLLPIFGQKSNPQLSLSFSPISRPSSVAVTPQVSALLFSGCAVAIGVSGGKDSQACAIRTSRYLDEVGHTGPRVLVHADLGSVEWRDSLPACERLADHLDLELVVVRRRAGDMMARWQKRWANNVARYRDLSCVRLILPWSTPSMRFCTSEMKVAPITSALKRRYPQLAIVNVSGVRRQESVARSRMPVSATEPKLRRKTYDGITWNPILEWSVDEVFAEIRQSGLGLHEAYTRYGSSRVSCAFCIMSSAHDLTASANCVENRDVYRAMVELEAESSFAFQGTRWLADVAPHLLSVEQLDRVRQAKSVSELRREIEKEIPNHLLYTKGWPTSMPTTAEADLVSSVRRRVSDLLHLDAGFLTGDSVHARYAALMEAKRMMAEKTRAGKELRCTIRAKESDAA